MSRVGAQECARNLRRVRYDAFGLRGCLAACTFYVQKKDTSRCQTRAHPPGTAHLRLCACVFVQATDWQQQRCNEFSLAWCMLGLLLCSFASCASLSSELLRVRASVARDHDIALVSRSFRSPYMRGYHDRGLDRIKSTICTQYCIKKAYQKTKR